MVRNWLKIYFYVFLNTVPLFGLIFIINPILIAFSLSEPFDHHFSFVILTIFCVCACGLTALPISFFSDKYRQISIVVLRSLFLIFFCVSIFYPVAGRQLDGVAAESYSLHYYFIMYFLYFFAFYILTYLFFRQNIVLRNLYVVFAILGFGTAVYYSMHRWQTAQPQTNFSDQTELTFASDRNIIVILADMLQGSTLEQYFTMYPKEKGDFQGFTCFSRATSPFPFTAYGAPAIFSGNIYGHDSTKSGLQARKDAETSSFMTDAADFGFDNTAIGLDTIKVHANQVSYGSFGSLGTATTLLALSAQRITKIPLASAPGMRLLVGYKKNSKIIMDRLIAAPIGKSKNKILYFHSMIPHAPIVFKRSDLGSKALFVGPLELNVENYFEEMGFFLGQVTHLLEHMKQIGIYEKSLIIIVGDHGHFIGNQDRLYGYPGAEDFHGRETGPWARNAAMYNAAILIKPPYNKGSLQISRAASSIIGLRALIKRYLANESGDLLKSFEILGKNKVVVFKDGIKSNPYAVHDDHEILEFTGNASTLAQEFAKDMWKDRDLSYVVGTQIKDVTKHLDSCWIKENGGAWLKGGPGKLAICPSGVEKKIYKLQIVCSGLINKRHPEQRVQVFLNDKKLDMFSITTLGKNTIDLTIPSNVLVNNNINVLKFVPLDAISPEEIKAWATTIPLSVYLSSFQLLEAGVIREGQQL